MNKRKINIEGINDLLQSTERISDELLSDDNNSDQDIYDARLAVECTKNLKKRVKQYCAEYGLSMREALTNWIEQGLRNEI